jgi:hypothetical protein
MSEANEYTQGQMQKLGDELDALQLKYDTRLLAAFMAGRAARLYAILINGEVTTQDEARKVWAVAGEEIENPPNRETKIMKLYDGQVLNPEQIN